MGALTSLFSNKEEKQARAVLARQKTIADQRKNQEAADAKESERARSRAASFAQLAQRQVLGGAGSGRAIL